MSEERGPRGVEWTLLVVMVIVAGFALLATGAIRGGDFAVVEFLMAGALGLATIRVWVHRQLAFHLSPMLWAVLAFCAYCFFRTTQAEVPYMAEAEWMRVWVYAAFFGIFTMHLFRPQYVQTLLVVLVVLAVASSLYAAYQYFTGSDRVWHFIRPTNYTRRGSGTFINPNNFAGYVAVLLPVATAFIIVGRMKITARMILVYAAVMFCVGMVVAASRGALVASAIGMLTLAFMLFRQSAFRLPAIAMISVLLLGGITFVAKDSLAHWRMKQTQNARMDSDSRVLLWQAASDMWRDHVWVGVGPAHYDAVFPQYRPDLLQNTRPLYAHNEYINTLADYGLVGAILVLAAILTAEFAFRYGWQKFRREGSSLDSVRSNRLALLLGASSGVTVALVHALFDYNFHMPAYALLVVTLLAVLAIAWRTDNTRWWWRPKLAGKFALTLICLATAAAFIWHGQSRWREQQYLTAYRRADINQPIYLQSLEGAAAAAPKNFSTIYSIGEYYRAGCWTGEGPYIEDGHKAMEWYAKAAALNPHDSLIPMRQAMTLTYIGEFKDTKTYLDRTEKLNPKDYYTLAQIGWCYFEQGLYAEAVRYLEKSMTARGYDNSVAETYLPLARERLKAEAGK